MNGLDSPQQASVYFRDRRDIVQEDNDSLFAWNDDDLAPGDARAFSQDELVSCEKCARLNPPTRTNCLYCGACLPISGMATESIKPTLRPLDDWEMGFSVIRLPDNPISTSTELRKLSELLRLDFGDVQSLLTSGASVPLARCTSQAEAALVKSRLETLGVDVVIVADTVLDSCSPKRVRAIELTDDSLIVYPPGRDNGTEIPSKEISLIVVGRRVIRRLEVSERSDKRRGKEVVDSRELSSDAERLDLYSQHSDSGWRIAADNFDFSCLRESKTLIASKNFKTLTDLLRERAPHAEYDDSYLRIRQQLSLIWPLEQRTESLGLQKPRRGRISTGAATTSDNELQFTRYSVLLHHLKRSKPGAKA